MSAGDRTFNGMSSGQLSIDENPPGPSWSMFEKVKELGVGSFGVVYLVKCMQHSVIKSDASNVLDSDS